MNTKVVLLTPIEPSRLGGIERVVTQFGKRLSGQYDLHVICSGESDRIYRDGPLDVSVVKGYTSLHIAPKVRKIIEQDHPSLIYVHNYNTYMPFAAWRIKKESRQIKIVLHAHYHPSATNWYKSIVKSLYDPIIGSKVVKDSDELIANSQSELTELKKKFVIKNSSVIYNGIDINEVRSCPAKEIGYGGEVIPLLWVGRIERYKNPIAAVSILNHMKDEYHLFMIGKGPLEDELKSYITKMNLGNRVHLLGRVTDADLYGWYKSAHCFIHLSSFESFGMTCIESLAAGTPVVANEDGYGLSETIKLFPNYIKSCNLESDSYEHIANLVDETARMKPVFVSLDRFDWDNLAKDLGAVFDRALSS
ncbi:MAG: glycosyltransferase family 4 protein [Nitrososphaerales archaeon]